MMQYEMSRIQNWVSTLHYSMSELEIQPNNMSVREVIILVGITNNWCEMKN